MQWFDSQRIPRGTNHYPHTYTGDVRLRALKAGARRLPAKNMLHKSCWKRFVPSMPERSLFSAEVSYELAAHAPMTP